MGWLLMIGAMMMMVTMMMKMIWVMMTKILSRCLMGAVNEIKIISDMCTGEKPALVGYDKVRIILIVIMFTVIVLVIVIVIVIIIVIVMMFTKLPL